MLDRITRWCGAFFLVGMGVLALVAASTLLWAVWPEDGRGEGAAAWVQAVGSVLGIAIAIWVPAHQKRTQLIGERKARSDALNVLAAVLSHGVALVDTHLHCVEQLADDDGWKRMDVNTLGFERAIHSIESIPLHSLPSSDVVGAVASAAFDLREAFRLFNDASGRINRIEWPTKEQIDHLREIAERVGASQTILSEAAKKAAVGA